MLTVPYQKDSGDLSCFFSSVDDINNSVAGLLVSPFKWLLANKESVVKKYGGKGYGILLAESLQSTVGGYSILSFELITTDFFQFPELKDPSGEEIVGISVFLSTHPSLEELTDYFLDNQHILKYVLTHVDEKNISGEYKFILDIYCEWNNYNHYVLSDEGIDFYDDSTDRYPSSSMVLSHEALITGVLEYLGIIVCKDDEEIRNSISTYKNRKTYVETQMAVNPNYDEVSDPYLPNISGLSTLISYAMTEDLNRQKDIFLGNSRRLDFSTEQEQYLRVVFEKFSDVEYISVRSSADIEDSDDKSFAGNFYTGFCGTQDFDRFKSEVMFVLLSGKDILRGAVGMGIVVMEVPGQAKVSGDFFPQGGGVMATTNYGDRTTITSERGMPVGITSGRGDGKTLDFDENGNPIQSCVKEYTSSYSNVQFGKFVLRGGDIDFINSPHELCDIGGDMFGAFSLDTYKGLVSLGKKLEQSLAHPLDIEFAIEAGKKYILQIRKFIDNHSRPETMSPPNVKLIHPVLHPGNILASLGFLDNVDLEVISLNLPNGRSVSEARDNQCLFICEELARQERKLGSYCLYVRVDLSTFPYIDRHTFPGLKLVIFGGLVNHFTTSHAYTVLRELGIPTLICNTMGGIDLSCIPQGEKVKAYIDGHKVAYIYQ